MRVDRYFESRFPGLSFSHIQRIVRKGEVRVNGKRVDTKDRLQIGQQVRIPPLKLNAPKRTSFLSPEDEKTRAFLKSIILHEDDDVMVLNKPMGLSGAGRLRHHAPSRRHARSAARRGSRRAEAAPGAPARQGHGRLPAGRQDAFRGGGAGENLPLARGAQDLLGAHRRRAEAAPGAHLDLSGQGRARGGFVHARRASTATRARATRSPITRWSRPRRRRSPGCRSSR